MGSIEIGQMNYEAYAQGLGREPKPPWEKLTPAVQDAWRFAAQTVIQNGWIRSQRNGGPDGG